jgi:hypothetical protein
LRIEYVKVAEFQKRGAAHFHCLVRFDGRAASGEYGAMRYSGPWSEYTLKRAIRIASRRIVLMAPPVQPGQADIAIRFGRQLDVRSVHGGSADILDHSRVARYLAKYTVKSCDDVELENPSAGLRVHLAELRSQARSVWQESSLGYGGSGSTNPYAMILKWAKSFGFRGHFMTKSRIYSTTFSALRCARAAYRRAETSVEDESFCSAGQLNFDEETDTIVVNRYEFVKSGWDSSDESALANAAANAAREWRQHGSEFQHESEEG